jgi:hypothetical protein
MNYAASKGKGIAMSKPIFIFAAGWRSGSTLLQRMLMSSGGALIWGESGGALQCFADAARRYKQMLGSGNIRYEYGFGGNGAEEFKQFQRNGGNDVYTWIACINPPEQIIKDALRRTLEDIYAETARRMGYQRWGVKEVFTGTDTARLLMELYPEAKFVFLVRNPLACILSIKRRDWMDQKGMRDPLMFYANHWKKLAAGFRSAGFGHYVRYEDLVEKQETRELLINYVELTGIPPDFISQSHADWKAHKMEKLTRVERLRIRMLLSDEMACHGYNP